MSILTIEYEADKPASITLSNVPEGGVSAAVIASTPINFGKKAGPKGDVNLGFVGATFNVEATLSSASAVPTALVVGLWGRADEANADDLALPNPHQIHLGSLNATADTVPFAFEFDADASFVVSNVYHATFNVKTKDIGYEAYVGAYCEGGTTVDFDLTVTYRRYWYQLLGV